MSSNEVVYVLKHLNFLLNTGDVDDVVDGENVETIITETKFFPFSSLC